MVVQHNLTAMNSNRMLGLTTTSQAKSTEKLSSGYKINRAADDAAGLSISEKMRKQIRGLTQASANAQDGISTVQTAEGALNEVQDMLQRMNELAVKSSNGTNSEDDREYIQNEIDRVSTTTKFNETYLLQGEGRQQAKAKNELTTISLTGADGTTPVDTKIKASIAAGNTYTAGKVTVGSVTAEITGGTASIDQSNISGALKKVLDATEAATVTFAHKVDGGVDKWTVDNVDYTAAQLKEMGLNASGTDDIEITKKFTASSNLPTGVSVDATGAKLAGLSIGTELNVTLKTDTAANGNGMTVAAYDPTYAPKALSFDLQVGADSSKDNKISVEIESMSASGLGLLDDTGRLLVNGKDSKNADAAINTIANAIQKVSTQRSALGAVQNRLEHTINNLDNVVENTTSAESQIRDTDMATEMVKYSNNNILAQAGQAMLAQSNQSNQGVLSLLQ